MELGQIRVLRGPNLWSKHPSIEAILLPTEGACFIDDIPGFELRLHERFPELALRHPTRKYDVKTIAHIFEFVALGLQSQIGCPVTFGQTLLLPDQRGVS